MTLSKLSKKPCQDVEHGNCATETLNENHCKKRADLPFTCSCLGGLQLRWHYNVAIIMVCSRLEGVVGGGGGDSNMKMPGCMCVNLQG